MKEASGFAASRRAGNLIWAVNDSGNAPRIELLANNGATRGYAEVDGVRNRDWEDIAAFTLDGTAYLLVAETGDNLAFHNTCSLFIVEEPPPPVGDVQLHVALPVAWEVKYRYEDGARDCEAVAVDVPGKKILLVSKRDRIPRVYELPLRPKQPGTQIAKFVGQLTLGEDPERIATKPGAPNFAWQPTAMDILSDGSAAVVTTYQRVLYYPRKPGESWAKTFARVPVALAPHGLVGCEDVAITPDGEAIYLTSERAGSPVVRYRRAR